MGEGRTAETPWGTIEPEHTIDHMVHGFARSTGMYTLMGVPSAAFWLEPSLNRMLSPLAAEVGVEMFRLLVASSSSEGTDRDYQLVQSLAPDSFADGFHGWGDAVGSIGWGRFELVTYDEARHQARVLVRNTWELEMQRHNEARWGCPFIQGKLIGMFSEAFGEPCWATEVETSYAADDPFVVFEIRPSERTIDSELQALRLAHHEARVGELRKLQEMKHARDDARRANEAKSAFLAVMSHELRTPLNAIIGYTELTRDVLEDAGMEESAGDLNRVLEAGNHLLDLISRVLELSRIEAGELELRPKQIDIAAFIGRVERLVRPLSTRNANVFRVELPDDLGATVVDETHLTQVLVNILGNAFKFTSDGTVTLAVSRPGPLVFTVRDTGIGIAPSHLIDIFESFHQADSSIQHRFGGTGLGLAIAHQLVDAMGGRLTVESELGKGSTFRVELPGQDAARLA